ncbi:MAG: SDR family NAD(P)-dependent oxidoreductase, partial [Bacteroidota bacterium]
MDLGIKNKVAFVSASSQGLGKAAALSLAKEGARLVICSRTKKSIDDTADEIRSLTGAEILPLVTDVTNADEIETAVKRAVEHFGTIDILVNNAGGPPTGKITTIPDSEWERGFNLTMMSMIRMTKAVLPIMERQKWGRIVSIVSLSAKQPIDDLLISSTLRPGILGLTKVLANQYGGSGITVNTVCPGYILTQRQKELSEARSKAQNITVEE